MGRKFEALGELARNCNTPVFCGMQISQHPEPGEMTEYGWWDGEIEDDVEYYMSEFGVNREEAILRTFDNEIENRQSWRRVNQLRLDCTPISDIILP